MVYRCRVRYDEIDRCAVGRWPGILGFSYTFGIHWSQPIEYLTKFPANTSATGDGTVRISLRSLNEINIELKEFDPKGIVLHLIVVMSISARERILGEPRHGCIKGTGTGGQQNVQNASGC